MPDSWNFSRFLANVIELEETLGMVTGMITTLREQLMEVLPEFGRHLGYDGKAIESHSTGRVNRTTGETSDPDADWGKHETSGIDARTGKPWKKIKTWFGYGVHLIADTHYEIPVALHLTPASHSEQVELRVMLKETFAETPELAARCRDFSADRGLDCEGRERCHQAGGVTPGDDGRIVPKPVVTSKCVRWFSPSPRPDSLTDCRVRPDRPRAACGRGCPRDSVVESNSHMGAAATQFRRYSPGNACASVRLAPTPAPARPRKTPQRKCLCD